MSTTYRRFEILLPLRFNNGKSVPKRLITTTIVELRDRFGAVSCESQAIRGHWQYQGDLFKDELVRVFVDTADVSEHKSFFTEFKETLKQRFEQVDIWLVSYPIEVL
jgi:hypothetical protein